MNYPSCPICKLILFFKTSFSNKAQDLAELKEELVISLPEDADTEEAIINNAISYGELTVEEVMIPRADIKAIDYSLSLPEIKAFISECGHTRYPVFESSLDNTKGYINIKDIIPFMQRKNAKLSDVLREMPVVAPSMRVVDLMRLMKEKKTHIALVVDEFGGTDGLVTLEDLMEKLVGKFEDEHDKPDESFYTRTSADTIIASGRMYVEDLEKEFGIDLSSKEEMEEDFDTISGLVMTIAGAVPEVGEIIKYDEVGLEFEIIERTPRLIKKLVIRKITQAEEEENL